MYDNMIRSKPSRVSLSRCLLCWALAAVAAQAVLAQERRPQIELSVPEWNFGEKWSGEPAATELTVRNVGDELLEIRKVGRDCACLVAKLEKLLLKPGESVKVELTYNTKKPVPQPVQKIWFETNDPLTPVANFIVTGSVHQIFNINVSHELSFGLLGPTETAERTVEIESLYDKPVRLELEQLKSEHFGARMKALDEGKRYKLTISTKPPLPFGQINVTAQVDTGLEFLPQLPIRISGYVQPPVTADPAALIVPKQMSRRTLRILRVSSRREEPLKILDISTSDECVQAELLPESPGKPRASASGQKLKIRVSLPPASELPKDGVTITIKTDDPDIKELIVPVRLKQKPGSQKD